MLRFFVGGTEVGLLGFLRLLLPLYSRLQPHEVLDHYTRGEIFGYVTAHPGAHYSLIREDLRLSNGVLAHHLGTMLRERVLTADRIGFRKVFYAADHRGPRKHLQDIQEAILTHVRERPGARQAAIARAMGLRRDAVLYHVRALEASGLVRTELDGSARRCYPVDRGWGIRGGRGSTPSDREPAQGTDRGAPPDARGRRVRQHRSSRASPRGRHEAPPGPPDP